MESSVEELNASATGLGSSGFQELRKTIYSDIKLVKIDIRFYSSVIFYQLLIETCSMTYYIFN